MFDNLKTVVIDRDAYGEGMHRWNESLRELAEECGFVSKLCRPYRAKTKGKVERFNGYLKGSFLVPLAASLKAVSLKLRAKEANVHVRCWLDEIANARMHAATNLFFNVVAKRYERGSMVLTSNLPFSPSGPARLQMTRRSPRRCWIDSCTTRISYRSYARATGSRTSERRVKRLAELPCPTAESKERMCTGGSDLLLRPDGMMGVVAQMPSSASVG